MAGVFLTSEIRSLFISCAGVLANNLGSLLAIDVAISERVSFFSSTGLLEITLLGPESTVASLEPLSAKLDSAETAGGV